MQNDLMGRALTLNGLVRFPERQLISQSPRSVTEESVRKGKKGYAEKHKGTHTIELRMLRMLSFPFSCFPFFLLLHHLRSRTMPLSESLALI